MPNSISSQQNKETSNHSGQISLSSVETSSYSTLLANIEKIQTNISRTDATEHAETSTIARLPSSINVSLKDIALDQLAIHTPETLTKSADLETDSDCLSWEHLDNDEFVLGKSAPNKSNESDSADCKANQMAYALEKNNPASLTPEELSTYTKFWCHQLYKQHIHENVQIADQSSENNFIDIYPTYLMNKIENQLVSWMQSHNVLSTEDLHNHINCLCKIGPIDHHSVKLNSILSTLLHAYFHTGEKNDKEEKEYAFIDTSLSEPLPAHPLVQNIEFFEAAARLTNRQSQNKEHQKTLNLINDVSNSLTVLFLLKTKDLNSVSKLCEKVSHSQAFSILTKEQARRIQIKTLKTTNVVSSEATTCFKHTIDTLSLGLKYCYKQLKAQLTMIDASRNSLGEIKQSHQQIIDDLTKAYEQFSNCHTQQHLAALLEKLLAMRINFVLNQNQTLLFDKTNLYRQENHLPTISKANTNEFEALENPANHLLNQLKEKQDAQIGKNVDCLIKILWDCFDDKANLELIATPALRTLLANNASITPYLTGESQIPRPTETYNAKAIFEHIKDYCQSQLKLHICALESVMIMHCYLEIEAQLTHLNPGNKWRLSHAIKDDLNKLFSKSNPNKRNTKILGSTRFEVSVKTLLKKLSQGTYQDKLTSLFLTCKNPLKQTLSHLLTEDELNALATEDNLVRLFLIALDPKLHEHLNDLDSFSALHQQEHLKNNIHSLKSPVFQPNAKMQISFNHNIIQANQNDERLQLTTMLTTLNKKDPRPKSQKDEQKNLGHQGIIIDQTSHMQLKEHLWEAGFTHSAFEAKLFSKHFKKLFLLPHLSDEKKALIRTVNQMDRVIDREEFLSLKKELSLLK